LNVTEIRQSEGLSLALVVTQLFRLLFGGYLTGLDQLHSYPMEYVVEAHTYVEASRKMGNAILTFSHL